LLERTCLCRVMVEHKHSLSGICHL
jgi:hypothetical protein